MKMIISILLLVCFGHNSYSQTVLDTDGLNNLDNVFLYSLREYCRTLDPATTKIVYIRKDYPIGESWPTQIEGFQIEYLDTFKEYKKAIKDNDGSIRVVGISPLHLKDGNFFVPVIPFGVSYRKKELHFSNGGGWNFYYEYNTEKKGLIYKSSTYSGI
jgi:hypothetical protein